MNYGEARAFVMDAAKSGSVLGLDSIRRLMHILGDIQEELQIIHIGGTNGKGSVGTYLDYIFREAGLHVGRFCSPAVFSPLEVWQYDGENITKDEYAQVMSQVKSACDIVVSQGWDMPTVFEIETAAAFVYFKLKKPDVVLLEVGMGGETDATNVITSPLCSVLTTISYDHMNFLGAKLTDIAKIKSGIIKNERPVFSSSQSEEVEEVLRIQSRIHSCPFQIVAKDSFSRIRVRPGRMEFYYKDVFLRTQMAGLYQVYNASVAFETAHYALPVLLGEKNHTHRSLERKIIEGIRKAYWPGRFEVIGEDPLFVIDGAHNEDAALQLAKTVQNCFTKQSLTYIIGVLADKEHDKMLKIMLPYAEKIYTVTPENARAMDAEVLKEEAMRYHSKVVSCGSIKEAVRRAQADGDPILAFGSLSYLGELRKCYEDMGKDRSNREG